MPKTSALLARAAGVAAGLLMTVSLTWALEVNLTNDLPYLDLQYEGKRVRIQRIQDTSHRLDNSFAKTSRPCPPFCIHPMQAAIGVDTVGELELLDFLVKKVRTNRGLLVDARLPEWYQRGTIPGSVNIPWTILTAGPDNPCTAKILRALDATEENGEWTFVKLSNCCCSAMVPGAINRRALSKTLLRWAIPRRNFITTGVACRFGSYWG